ncbi:MAG: hypothetical protein IPM82_16370 [Saprospiraceae bacterium]|nr:hypothetical protein [Saprospiraceae bacterium]
MEIRRYPEERVPTEAGTTPTSRFHRRRPAGDRGTGGCRCFGAIEMDKSRQSTSFKTTGMRGPR